VEKGGKLPKPPIWGTHIRWMKLCPIAWQIVKDGRYPLQEYTTPEIIEECGKKQHNELLFEVVEWIEKSLDPLIFEKEPVKLFSVLLGEEWRKVVVRPDGYALIKVSNSLANLVIEVTTRSLKYVPSEWLVAYMVPFYITNLQPTFTLLVTPLQTQIYPLSTHAMTGLEKLLKSPPEARVDPQTCYNCDLRSVCPQPVV